MTIYFDFFINKKWKNSCKYHKSYEYCIRLIVKEEKYKISRTKYQQFQHLKVGNTLLMNHPTCQQIPYMKLFVEIMQYITHNRKKLKRRSTWKKPDIVSGYKTTAQI